jgi:hypothetical protein
MADKTTTKDLQSENDRLRKLLEDNGISTEQVDDPTYGLAGNLADLQRLGKIVASPGKTNIEDAFVIPASIDPDTGDQTPAQTVSGKDPSEVV